MGAMSYVLPSDVDERPISVIGGGTLGRRIKKQVFRELDRLAESDAILATNSSSYPSSRLVDAVESQSGC